MKSINHLLFAALLISAGPASALSTDKDQPIQLEADSADIDEKKKLSVYSGNVVLTQGTIRITADKLEVYGDRSNADKIIAHGSPVTFSQQPDKGEMFRGRSKRAEFHTNSDQIHLIDDAVLAQGETRRMASDRIVYDRKKALMKAGASAQGKRRVHITFDPKQ